MSGMFDGEARPVQRRKMRASLLGKAPFGFRFNILILNRTPKVFTYGRSQFVCECRCGKTFIIAEIELYAWRPKCECYDTPEDKAAWAEWLSKGRIIQAQPGELVGDGRYVATDLEDGDFRLFRSIAGPSYVWGHKYGSPKFYPMGLRCKPDDTRWKVPADFVPPVRVKATSPTGPMAPTGS